MIVEFKDLQDKRNPLNGTKMATSAELSKLLDSLTARPRFFLELIGQNGYRLLVGVAKSMGCVQHSRNDCELPYLVAIDPKSAMTGEVVEYLVNGELTLVHDRFCLPFETVKKIAAYFLETGERSPRVSWEAI